jgi:hypothetical protein
MKNFRILLALIVLLSACSLPPTYIGDKLPPTKHVDVYYSISAVKRDYKVIGHLQSRKYIQKALERNLGLSARRVGGDAVIIFRAEHNRVNADVLKYTH